MTTGKDKAAVKALAGDLRARGWGVSEGHEGEEAYCRANLEVELTRYATGREFDEYPAMFVSPTFARWNLDLRERRAERYLYHGGMTGFESPVNDDFGGVVGMSVRDVGPMPLTLAMGGFSLGSSASYDLLRAKGDWACDLYAVEKGEHFVRVTNPDPGPTDTAAYYRVDEETAARVVAVGPLEAHGEMERIVEEIEGSIRSG